MFVCLPISVQIKFHFNSNLISLYNKRTERGIFFCHYVQLFQYVKQVALVETLEISIIVLANVDVKFKHT